MLLGAIWGGAGWGNQGWTWVQFWNVVWLICGLQTDFAGTWLGLYETLSGVRLKISKTVSCSMTFVDLGFVKLFPPGSHHFLFCISLGRQVKTVITSSLLSCLLCVCNKWSRSFRSFITECILFLSGSHISLYPSLNFVVYVPSQRHTPLYMKNKDGKTWLFNVSLEVLIKRINSDRAFI